MTYLSFIISSEGRGVNKVKREVTGKDGVNFNPVPILGGAIRDQ